MTEEITANFTQITTKETIKRKVNPDIIEAVYEHKRRMPRLGIVGERKPAMVFDTDPPNVLKAMQDAGIPLVQLKTKKGPVTVNADAAYVRFGRFMSRNAVVKLDNGQKIKTCEDDDVLHNKLADARIAVIRKRGAPSTLTNG